MVKGTARTLDSARVDGRGERSQASTPLSLTAFNQIGIKVNLFNRHNFIIILCASHF